MTTPQELKNRYTSLYDYMVASRDTKNMMAFGRVMTEMMDVMIQKMPADAEEMIDKLEAIKWHQYLTAKEAETIVNKMDPKAPWNGAHWRQAMDNLGIPVENEPYYNSCALWTEMNKQYSDHGETVAELLGQPLDAIPADKIVPAMHRMALDLLCDKDGVYNIRDYFGL